MNVDAYDHGSWYSIVGVGIGYFLFCAAIFLLLFMLPWAIFALV